MWDRKAIDVHLDKLSGLGAEPIQKDSFDIWKDGYDLRKRERDAKKLPCKARTSVKNLKPPARTRLFNTEKRSR